MKMLTEMEIDPKLKKVELLRTIEVDKLELKQQVKKYERKTIYKKIGGIWNR